MMLPRYVRARESIATRGLSLGMVRYLNWLLHRDIVHGDDYKERDV
jgi:hypothetical protein